MRTKDFATTTFAQSHRAAVTDAERKLWYALRGRRFGGHKFVRQFSVDPYFADFCCRTSRLIVEADGPQHSESQHDARRDACLVAEGFSVLRFWNNDILNDFESVRETITTALDGRLEPYDTVSG